MLVCSVHTASTACLLRDPSVSITEVPTFFFPVKGLLGSFYINKI